MDGVTRGSKILRRTQFATAALSLCIGIGAQTISNKYFTPFASKLSPQSTQINFVQQTWPTVSQSSQLLDTFKAQAPATTNPINPRCVPCVVPRVEATAPQSRPTLVPNTTYDAFAI